MTVEVFESGARARDRLLSCSDMMMIDVIIMFVIILQDSVVFECVSKFTASQLESRAALPPPVARILLFLIFLILKRNALIYLILLINLVFAL